MPRARYEREVPIWRKPQCFANFDESCLLSLVEGCQWLEECRKATPLNCVEAKQGEKQK